MDDSNIKVDHLVPSACRLEWRNKDERPLDVRKCQLLDVAPVGEWDIGSRTHVFRLRRECKTAIVRAMADFKF